MNIKDVLKNGHYQSSINIHGNTSLNMDVTSTDRLLHCVLAGNFHLINS